MKAVAPPDIEERKLIQSAYRDLLKSFKIDITKDERKVIRKAYEMAVEAHKTQRRKSGEPYILHPIAVAKICAQEIGLDAISGISALLHDVVEDTPVTLKNIEEGFGPQIAMIVDGLTKFDKIFDVTQVPQTEKSSAFTAIKSPQAENFKKILLTLAKDVRVVVIKMADRLHNMRTIGSMPHHKQLKIASETSFIYAPLAHRLGLYNVKNEMEDLCMKITDRESFDFITKKLAETKDQRAEYVQQFIQPIQQEIAGMNVSYKIFGRAKSISSIANKLRKKKVPFEEIYDLFAVRVILDIPKEREKSLCWQVYSIITDHYTPVPERLKDWVATPKPNGYESLHTTVMGPEGRFVEVQIRSNRMDEIAERGFAAHWRYKGVMKDNIFETWLSRAKETLENPDSDAIDFLNDFKADLFSEEVYVFTPKGDMRYFPKGSTSLDFAFDIHSEVGYHTKAVKVGGRIVPMSYKLRNGDQVEVITNKSQKPNEGWLKLVNTGKARSRIRQALREEKMLLAELGKETLIRKMKNLKLDFEDNVDALVVYFNMHSRMDLYYATHRGNINLSELKQLKVEKGKLLPSKETGEVKIGKPEEKEVSRKRRVFKGQPKLLIDGEDANQYAYMLSTCCNPVQGDDVFAYVTAKGGIKVHRTTCPNAEHMQATYGYRIKKASWIDSANTDFIADIMITGMDDLGLVRKLTEIIAFQLKINMRSISMNGDEGYFEGKISVVVVNKDQLNHLINTLNELDGVSSVVRLNH